MTHAARPVANVDWPRRSPALHSFRRHRGGGADQGDTLDRASGGLFMNEVAVRPVLTAASTCKKEPD